MSVKRVRAHHRRDGTVVVMMELSSTAWAELEAQAANGSHPDAADYLAATIHMMVIEAEPKSAPCDDDADPYGDGIPF